MVLLSLRVHQAGQRTAAFKGTHEIVNILWKSKDTAARFFFFFMVFPLKAEQKHQRLLTFQKNNIFSPVVTARQQLFCHEGEKFSSRTQASVGEVAEDFLHGKTAVLLVTSQRGGGGDFTFSDQLEQAS